jgi:hypothetical protein
MRLTRQETPDREVIFVGTFGTENSLEILAIREIPKV